MLKRVLSIALSLMFILTTMVVPTFADTTTSVTYYVGETFVV